MSRQSKLTFRNWGIIVLILACHFVYSQGLCDKNNWPAGAVDGGFKIDGDVSAGCSPLTVKLKDLSGGTDIRYDFYYNGKAFSALDKVGNKDSVNALFANTNIEVYRILQYGKKNGKDMFACKTISVRPNSKPVFSYNSCNSNFLNLIVPINQANNFDSYTIGWDDGTPPTVFNKLPYTINKTFNTNRNNRSILIWGNTTNSTNCYKPDSIILEMNHGGNIPKIVKLEVEDNGMRGRLEFEGAYDKHSIYRIDKFGQYSIPNLIGSHEPGILNVELKENESNCFVVLRNPNAAYATCNEISGEVCSVKIDSLIYLNPNENKIVFREYTNTNDVTLVNNTKVISISNKLIVKNFSNGSTTKKDVYGKNIVDKQNCLDQVCYQLETRIVGNWESGTYNFPFFSTSLSNVKCTDRSSIPPPPITNARLSVVSNNTIELLFGDNSGWLIEKDLYYLYKNDKSGHLQKVDSIPDSQNKRFKIEENTYLNSHCFQIGYKDKCGSTSKLSETMCTLHLQASENAELNWTTNSPFGNSTIQSFELISIDENTSAEFVEKVLGQNINSSSVDISNSEIEAKFKIRALGNGNISSISNQISIPIEALFFIPDAFTPNEDNINNLFEIKGRFGRVNNYNLTIYDRWGNRIVEITDKTESWDGKRHGTPLPFGSYLYDLKIGLNKGETIRKIGKFEIL
ncbi:T9SS type B sorting domain-containing protein [Lacihabitans soyangensis]|uniref:T9SS type B sorting domain-containing protein n=1 Tax=Lacihabitans soyangensis TaxID=869394 RepID=UPI0020CDFBDB|nr:gliding motility-associated C-terminal domain-containing protein [Lacihabitans soyangensis]